MLPPGRATLEMRRAATASRAAIMTMGMLAVARLAARVPVVPWVTKTAGSSSASSSARSGSRAGLPLAHRYSKMMVLPSTWPRSRRPPRSASSRLAVFSAVPRPRKAMRAGFEGCPRATPGAARAPAPRTASNRRRAITERLHGRWCSSAPWKSEGTGGLGPVQARGDSAVEEIVAVVATHHAEVLGGDALVMEHLDEAPVAVGGHGIVRLPTVRGAENPRGSDGLDEIRRASGRERASIRVVCET